MRHPFGLVDKHLQLFLSFPFQHLDRILLEREQAQTTTSSRGLTSIVAQTAPHHLLYLKSNPQMLPP